MDRVNQPVALCEERLAFPLWGEPAPPLSDCLQSSTALRGKVSACVLRFFDASGWGLTRSRGPLPLHSKVPF
jgi:hypothetical protein